MGLPPIFVIFDKLSFWYLNNIYSDKIFILLFNNLSDV